MDEKLKDIRILIVDSDRTTVSIIRDTLAAFGFSNIETSYSIESATSLLLSDKTYGFVICDRMLKDGDSLKMIKSIRAYSKCLNRLVPIIMVTDKGSLNEVKEARDAGTTEFLLKPFSAESLKSKIVEIIERPRDFIISYFYVGPDRRRKKREINFKDRRNIKSKNKKKE